MNWLTLSISTYFLLSCNTGIIEQTGNQANNHSNQIVSSQQAKIVSSSHTQNQNVVKSGNYSFQFNFAQGLPQPLIDLNSFFQGTLIRELGEFKLEDMPDLLSPENQVLMLLSDPINFPWTPHPNPPSHTSSGIARYLGYISEDVIGDEEGFKSIGGVTISLNPSLQLKIFTHYSIHIIYQGRIIGYALVDEMNLDLVMKDPRVQQMLSFPQNQGYLKGQLKTNKGIDTLMTLEFHEKYHQGYIERYGLLLSKEPRENKDPILDYLILDSFYPESLEEVLKPYIIQSLNESFKTSFYPFE